MSESSTIFNRKLLRSHRDRAAKNYKENNFLFAETAKRLKERLDEINMPFEFGLNLGCHSGELNLLLSNRFKNTRWVLSDLSPQLAMLAFNSQSNSAIAMDEESLAFKDEAFDLVTSNLSLHWVNDFPGTLNQIHRILKPNGLFIANLFGEHTLKELRQALTQAETEIDNGISPRISPYVKIKDAGDLLLRSGFALPVADVETITVRYSNALNLMRDLRAMGESNTMHARRKIFTRRSILFRAAEIYKDEFKDKNGNIPASFDIISLIGWVPHKSQQKPLEPGSGQVRLENAVNLE